MTAFPPSKLPAWGRQSWERRRYLTLNSILGWTHLISEPRLYFQLKMTVVIPVYYLRISRKVMGKEEEKNKIIHWLSHTFSEYWWPTKSQSRAFSFLCWDPSFNGKTNGVDVHLDQCTAFNRSSSPGRQLGSGNVIDSLSHPVSPSVHSRYLIIEDNWGFFCPLINIMTI